MTCCAVWEEVRVWMGFNVSCLPVIFKDTELASVLTVVTQTFYIFKQASLKLKLSTPTDGLWSAFNIYYAIFTIPTF